LRPASILVENDGDDGGGAEKGEDGVGIDDDDDGRGRMKVAWDKGVNDDRLLVEREVEGGVAGGGVELLLLLPITINGPVVDNDGDE
jgi:hypothetical protein